MNGKEINWEPKDLLIAGYTAKDQNSLREHIEELEKIGIPAPPAVLMIYQLSPELLCNESEITAVRNDSSGEAEVVILNIEGEWTLGLEATIRIGFLKLSRFKSRNKFVRSRYQRNYGL